MVRLGCVLLVLLSLSTAGWSKPIGQMRSFHLPGLNDFQRFDPVRPAIQANIAPNARFGLGVLWTETRENPSEAGYGPRDGHPQATPCSRWIFGQILSRDSTLRQLPLNSALPNRSKKTVWEGRLETDIRYYRRRACEEMSAASRAVTPAARDRRLQLVGVYLDHLKALNAPSPFDDQQFASMLERSAFNWSGNMSQVQRA